MHRRLALHGARVQRREDPIDKLSGQSPAREGVERIHPARHPWIVVTYPRSDPSPLKENKQCSGDGRVVEGSQHALVGHLVGPRGRPVAGDGVQPNVQGAKLNVTGGEGRHHPERVFVSTVPKEIGSRRR